MKKILALTSLIFALSVGVTAMAADLTEVDNDADGVTYTTANAGGYATVLVQGPDTATDIVYVDQADSVFDASLDLILKADIADGKYTIKFGGAGKETTTQEFTLKTATTDPDPDPAPADTVEMQAVGIITDNNDGTKNAAYETLVSSSYNKIKFTCTVGEETKEATLNIDGIDNLTDMAAYVVVLVKNVPSEVTNLKVALVNVAGSN